MPHNADWAEGVERRACVCRIESTMAERCSDADIISLQAQDIPDHGCGSSLFEKRNTNNCVSSQVPIVSSRMSQI